MKLKISLTYKTISALLIGIFFVSETIAQDIHFSQFDSSPLNLNPANTGTMNADYRLAANQKTQWNSVGSPFATYSFSYDMRLLKKDERKSYFGVGLVAFTDKAGASNFRTSLYAISVSSILKVNETNWLSLGIQSGLGQKSMKIDNLTWDNQFSNGAFDSNLPTGEVSTGNQIKYLDLSTGMALNGGIEDEYEYQFGVAYFHANQPKGSFIGSEEKKLSSKVVIHSNLRVKLRRPISKPDAFLVPKVWFLKQGGHHEFFIGTMYEFIVHGAAKYTTYGNKVKFGVGGFYRVGDAFVAMVNFDYGKITVGLSYDVTTSKLRDASTYRGGVELSLIFKNVFDTELIKLQK